MSLLDTDKYKLTCGQVIYKHYPNTQVTYKLFDRTNKLDWSIPKFTRLVLDRIEALCDKKFTQFELYQLSNLGLSDDYLNFLKKFQFNQKYISFTNGLEISGPWSEVCLFEVPLLSILSESHYDIYNIHTLDEFNRLCLCNLELAKSNQIEFTEFGTRRRRSKLHQEYAIKTLLPVLDGTSNIEFGLKYNIPIVGSIGHELPMGLLGFHDTNSANVLAHTLFGEEFPLKYILTDTFTTDFFLHYEPKIILSHDVRQDSGSVFEYIDKIVTFYKNNNIDPLKRTILFTDSLDIKKCITIKDYCKNKINYKFGLGTSISNGFSDSLNIVIKIIKSNGRSVYKLSDDPSKSIH